MSNRALLKPSTLGKRGKCSTSDYIFSLLMPSRGLNSRTLWWWSKCFTSVTANSLSTVLLSLFYLLVPAMEAWLKLSTLEWWGKCSTTLCCSHFHVLVCHFIPTTGLPLIPFSPSLTKGSKLKDLVMMKQVFYHCVTANSLSSVLLAIFSFLVSWLGLESNS